MYTLQATNQDTPTTTFDLSRCHPSGLSWVQIDPFEREPHPLTEDTVGTFLGGSVAPCEPKFANPYVLTITRACWKHFRGAWTQRRGTKEGRGGAKEAVGIQTGILVIDGKIEGTDSIRLTSTPDVDGAAGACEGGTKGCVSQCLE